MNLIRADKKEERVVHVVLRIRKSQRNFQIERNLIVQDLKVQDQEAPQPERKKPVTIKKTNIQVHDLDQNHHPNKAAKEAKNTQKNQFPDKK